VGPDERVYSVHADTIGMWGLRGLQVQARIYLDPRAGLQDYPSPIRWLWGLLLSCTKRAGRVFAVVLTIAAGVTSPLAWSQSRTRLQDVAVACEVLGAVLAARAHNTPFVLAAAFLAMCLKPEALLGVAAGVLTAWPDPRAVFALGAAALLWWAVLGLIFGPRLAGCLMRALFQKHDHAYGRTHQRGSPHRLLVDLCMIAPFAVVCGPWPKEAVAIVAVHALSPVRNVRTIIAAEVLLRMSFVHAASWWLLVPSFAYDVYLWHRLRLIYDPVTDELRKALC